MEGFSLNHGTPDVNIYCELHCIYYTLDGS